MAITANTIWDFQTGGNDLNGGGFDATIPSFGTDYSQLTTVQATLTTLSTVAALTNTISVSPTDYTVSLQDIGNILFLTAGTATAGFYQITNVTVGTNTWVMDRAVGTAAQTTPGMMGGCRNLITSNSFSSAALVAGNIVYIKSGSYTTSINYTSQTPGTSSSTIQILGYKSSHGDNPQGSDRPVFANNLTNLIIGTSTFVRNISFLYSGSSAAFQTGSFCLLENCKVISSGLTSSTNAIALGGSSRVINTEISAPFSIGLNTNGGTSFIHGCNFHNCNVAISIPQSIITITNSLATSCSTAAVSFGSNLSLIFLTNNTFYGAEAPTGVCIDGRKPTSPSHSLFLNNIIYGFSTGASWTTALDNWWDYNCYFNNTTNTTINITTGSHDLITNPAFVNAVGGNFQITGPI